MHKFLYFFLLAFILIGCKEKEQDVQMVPLNNVWKVDTKYKFDLDISDSQNSKDIIFVVRNNNDYPYSNLRLFVDFQGDRDTLNYIMAKPNGQWLGKGFGEVKEIHFQYKMKYKFPNNGLYTISVQQAMRKDQLQGLEDFGVLIENSQP